MNSFSLSTVIPKTNEISTRSSFSEANEDSDLPKNIFEACLQGNLDAVRKFHCCCTTTALRDDQGRTPLHCACIGGNDSIVRFLLQSADINAIDNNNQKPLDVCDKSIIEYVSHIFLRRTIRNTNKCNQCIKSSIIKTPIQKQIDENTSSCTSFRCN